MFSRPTQLIIKEITYNETTDIQLQMKVTEHINILMHVYRGVCVRARAYSILYLFIPIFATFSH